MLSEIWACLLWFLVSDLLFLKSLTHPFSNYPSKLLLGIICFISTEDVPWEKKYICIFLDIWLPSLGQSFLFLSLSLFQIRQTYYIHLRTRKPKVIDSAKTYFHTTYVIITLKLHSHGIGQTVNGRRWETPCEWHGKKQTVRQNDRTA